MFANNTELLAGHIINMSPQPIKFDSTKKVPFDQAYWVVPDLLMAGYYPGSALIKDPHPQLSALLQCGIRHFINLMQTDESHWYGQPIKAYEAQAQALAGELGIEVTFDRMPIKDMEVPSRIEMAQILDRIDQKINNDKPVYVHCLGGVGRTGTVIGCYLARHGYASGHRILQLIQQLRQNTATHDRPAPESRPQVDMVISWVEGE